MAESIVNYPKRAFFSKGKQKHFLKRIQKILGISNEALAEICEVTVRSLSDWKREKYSIPFPILQKLCRATHIPMPKEISVKDPFWYTSLGSKIGGVITYKKYGTIGGDPEYRKKRWYEWWETEGRFKPHPLINTNLPITLPVKSSSLAEFIGIILGDGGITKNQVTVTLHGRDDREYIKYVSGLCEKLFCVKPSLYEHRGDVSKNIVISRSKLVTFLTDMGLVVGSKVKQQVKIPLWITKNQQYTISCIRGLFDTDGCFYIDKHNHKGKIYSNCAMNFTNRSIPILIFFKKTLERLGFHPTQKTKFSVFLRREDEIIEYFRSVKSSNLKHLNKLERYLQNRYGEVPKWS